MLILHRYAPKISFIMRLKTLFAISLLGLSSAAFSMENNTTTPVSIISSAPQYPFYVGLMTGYGNTDWSRLVSQDPLTSLATPTSASGSGAIFGGLVGYQFTSYIALEAQYIHYPNSTVNFLPGNPTYPGITQFSSATNYYALIAQISAPLPFDNNRFDALGDLGAAMVQRSDVLADIHDYRPTFGFGLDYHLSSHWVAVTAFNYTPGTGSAAENASAEYIPYLYSGQFIVEYKF